MLTGSHNILLMERVTETLAGRTAILRLLPMSNREVIHNAQKQLPWESNRHEKHNGSLSYKELWEAFLRGFYPEIVANPERDISLWLASYIQTYLERDVRGLRHVVDLTQFQSFLRTLAARSGQLLNMSDIARDLGIAVNTIKAWISVLEATYQIIILRPYFANIGKQLVKTPKVYFTDVGTLCYLSGLKDYRHAASGSLGGAIFETAVVSEIVKTITHRGDTPAVYFWRTRSVNKIDLIVEYQGNLIPLEAKSSATPRPKMASSIQEFQRDLRKRSGKGYVIHPGDITLLLAPNVSAIPFTTL